MKTEKVFWGLFFIAGAVFLLMSKLGIMEYELGIFSLILAIVFVGTLLNGLIHLRFTEIFFSIAFLCIIFAKPLQIESITPWPVLAAALLGSIGCSILFGNRCGWKNAKGNCWHVHSKKNDGDNFHVGQEQLNGERIMIQSTFGSSVKYINSDNFEYADIHCHFSGSKVYFDNALIQKGNATIHLDVSFSGVELFVPKTWSIVNNANFTFGGLDEKNRNDSSGSPSLTLTGGVSFGGVTIIYI